jgi:quercetin dioxygenase-like cupin family protein
MESMYAVTAQKATKLDLPKRTVQVFIGAEAYKSPHMTMGKTIVEPHTEMTPHTHDDEEEIIFVTSGTGLTIVGGAEEPLLPDTAVVFPVGVEHVVKNTGDETLEFVFVFTPPFHFQGRI